jgi:hypothetical protein
VRGRGVVAAKAVDLELALLADASGSIDDHESSDSLTNVSPWWLWRI